MVDIDIDAHISGVLQHVSQNYQPLYNKSNYFEEPLAYRAASPNKYTRSL